MSIGKGQGGRGGSVLKIYVAGGVACALFSVGAYLVGIRPAIARYDDQANRQTELSSARKKAAGLVGARNNVANQLNATNEALNNLTLHLAPASTVNQRLSNLTALATKECGLTIDEMRPGAVTESADYQTVSILIAGSGTYPNCAKFLHRLRHVFPDTAVRSFETTNNSSSPDSPAATFQFELAWHAAKG